MPTINLTNNTDVILTASSADDNATLNRYLKSVLTFKTPPSFDTISSLLVKDQRELDFPIALSATGEGKFAIEETTLDVQLGARFVRTRGNANCGGLRYRKRLHFRHYQRRGVYPDQLLLGCRDRQAS